MLVWSTSSRTVLGLHVNFKLMRFKPAVQEPFWSLAKTTDSQTASFHHLVHPSETRQGSVVLSDCVRT